MDGCIVRYRATSPIVVEMVLGMEMCCLSTVPPLCRMFMQRDDFFVLDPTCRFK